MGVISFFSSFTSFWPDDIVGQARHDVFRYTGNVVGLLLVFFRQDAS
jgi:hypothetical protein